ncbi:exonuclease [archaeon]|nr:MAG: exonuclease [archaeon]
MIERTFILLDGIGDRMERTLWDSGITTWGDFMGASSVPRISSQRKLRYDKDLLKASANLSVRNGDFFAHRLPGNEHWRLFETFRDDVVYLDIETTGHFAGNATTVVGLYDGATFKAFVRGKDLTREALASALDGKKMVVTFFGRGFDIPVLLHEFDIPVPPLHFDLCFAAKRLNMHGGLKVIERELGICRSDDTQGLSGADAVRLWYRYKRHEDESALSTLLQYNKEDVVNLEYLASKIFESLKTKVTGSF